jgi:hypothetical protein
MVALAIALGGLALVLGHTRRLSGVAALTSDSVAIALLVYGTSGPRSPFLALTLALILQGGLLGGSQGALAGSGAGGAILLSLHKTLHGQPDPTVGDLAVLQLACGLTAAWLWRRAQMFLGALRDDVGQQKQGTRELDRARQLLSWQRLNLQIASCATLEQLARLATSQAANIAGAAATVELASSAHASDTQGSEDHTRLPIPGGASLGLITICRGRDALSQGQRDALEHLAALIGLRDAALRSVAGQERQQAALTALWEISGLLRVADRGHEIVRDACGRLAAALDLDWLAVLVPDERHSLAPLLVARGRAGGYAPSISGAQLRLAAEALRAEHPLVRQEGAAVTACLPICLVGRTPLVLAARGNATDAATQTLLMLFGELIADRLAANGAALDQELLCREVAA